ncbi:nucleotidyltransferase family protein [Vagococcus sp. PNs007]|uniref:Nucleotidyltransferase family protein n=1 Tax=Vagococcus proximus TaxID=2991417 RepID=A0ABT5X2S9_9ENTE|nr:nucleotidyltransferase family protein [Vagococcus proximus]MDF0480301.1 nucleotidyltransferase family protein [Vagococcus proximus]
MFETKVREIIENNQEIMDVLRIIEGLDLKEGCLCAGTIRNLIWQEVFDNSETAMILTDVDVIFFDPEMSYDETLKREKELNSNTPNCQWELKNQVYMHVHHPNQTPYKSVEDAISNFPERCTAVGAYLENDKLRLIAPFGWNDNVRGIVRPTPSFSESSTNLAYYKTRVESKNWQMRWPKLIIKEN